MYSILLLWIVSILFLWILPLEQHACLQPALVGECQNYTARWYYDSLESQCRQFYFGGCGGNNNNFLSQEDCQRSCDHGYQPPPPPGPQQQPFVTAPPQLPEPRTPFSTGIFCVLLILWVIYAGNNTEYRILCSNSDFSPISHTFKRTIIHSNRMSFSERCTS